MRKVYLLDYVAGNVRSLVNAIEKVGYTVEWIKSPEDVAKADVSAEVIQSMSFCILYTKSMFIKLINWP